MSELIVDVHSHPLIEEYLGVLSSAPGGPSLVPHPPWSFSEHLEMMDRHGIGTAILSLPGMTEILEGDAGRATARRLNERLAELVAAHPERLGAFAVVPTDDVDAGIEEMVYALDELHLDGVTGAPHRRGVYLGEPHYDPWFEEMDRRGVTLFVHPGTPPSFDPATSRLNVSILEFMFETTRMVTGLVLSGTKSRFPGIRIIATHGGGTIPYLAHRISIGAQMPWAFRDGVALSVPEVLAALASFHYDLTAATSPAQLDAMSQVVPASQLLMGFDYPMMPELTIDPAIASFDVYGGLDGASKQAIVRTNALQLFPRLAAGAATAT